MRRHYRIGTVAAQGGVAAMGILPEGVHRFLQAMCGANYRAGGQVVGKARRGVKKQR